MGVSMRKIISEKILFKPSKEDPEVVAREINEGKRPSHWNVAGHPEHNIWVLMLEMNQMAREEKLIRLHNKEKGTVIQTV